MPKNKNFNRDEKKIDKQIPVPISQFQSPILNALVEKRVIYLSGSISTSSADFFTVFNNTGISGASDWSSFSALFDEYRIVAVEMYLFSIRSNIVLSDTLNKIAVAVYDNDDASALSSVITALEYDNHLIFPTVWTSGKIFRKKWLVPNSLNAPIPWYDIGSPTQPGSIKMASQGNTVSVAYLDYIVKYYVEFRGRR